ncbi:MAG: DUF3106 domain-containing protein [Opitutaceae bacterium]|nr:DUF3106 domain-containing protein [Opitutaceae bacterium]
MKTNHLAMIFAAAILFAPVAVPLRAAETPAPPAHPSAVVKEMASVERFLSLSDAELDQMVLVIQRIRAMKPEERAALRQEIAKYCRLTDSQRQQMRMGWGWMPREIQDGWREMMQGATPERRAEIQAKLQSLSPEERGVLRQQLVREYLKAKAAKK